MIAVVIFALGGALAFWLSRDHGKIRCVFRQHRCIRNAAGLRQPGRVVQMASTRATPSALTTSRASTRNRYQDAPLAAAQAQVQTQPSWLRRVPSAIPGARPQAGAGTRHRCRTDFKQNCTLPASSASNMPPAARDQAVAGVGLTKAALSRTSEGFRKEDIAAEARRGCPGVCGANHQRWPTCRN